VIEKLPVGMGRYIPFKSGSSRLVKRPVIEEIDNPNATRNFSGAS
jgi:hypothetical protein